MATEIRTGIRLDGDASGMKAAFADGEKAVKQLNKDIDAAAKGSGFLGQEMSGAAKSALALGAAVAGWQVGRTIIAVADDMQVLQSRLKLVTSSASEQAFVQQRLFAIAQQSRVSYTELGATYAQIARATSELGISQSRLLGVTQTIGQAMAISGGSAQAMQAALTQLSQGLASGTLRGEELNSILEQTPRLAQAIAEGMGVSMGQLRALGAEGKITAQTVIESLERAAPTLAREFATVTPTVSQAFTTLKNSSADFIDQLDRATGTSKAASDGITTVARAVKAVADSIVDNQKAWNIISGVLGGAAAAGALAISLGGIGAALGRIAGLVAAHPVLAAIIGGGAVAGAVGAAQDSYNASRAGAQTNVDNLQARLAEIEVLMQRGAGASDAAKLQANRARLLKRLEAAQERLDAFDREPEGARESFRAAEARDRRNVESSAAFPGAKPLEEVRKYAKLAIDIQREAYDQSVEIAKSYQRQMYLVDNDDAREALAKEMNQLLIQVDRDAKDKLKSLAEKGASDAKALAEAQFAQRKASAELIASVDRYALADQQRSNEQFYRLGLVDIEQYHQRKADLATQDLDISARLVQAELEQARALERSARRAADKAQATARVLGLEKQLVELAAQRLAAAEAPGNERDVRERQRETDLQDQTSRERMANTAAGYGLATQLEDDTRRLRLSGIADPTARARAQLDADLQRRREQIASIFNDDARERASDSFNAYVVARNDELAERLKPGWQKMVEAWSDSNRQMRETHATLMEGILKQGEDMWVKLAQTGKLSSREMVNFIIGEMARLTYRQSIAGPLSGALNGLLGGAMSWLFGGGDDGSYNTLEANRLARRASGGSYGPGLVLRGEGGPELSWENSGGYVFNAAETRDILAGAAGGGASVTVNVINQAGAAVEVQQRQTSAGLTLDVVIGQIEEAMADRVAAGQGSLARAVEGRYGLNPALA